MTPDHAKEIARLALKRGEYESHMLREVLNYAFDALCTMRSTNEMDTLLEELRAELSGSQRSEIALSAPDEPQPPPNTGREPR